MNTKTAELIMKKGREEAKKSIVIAQTTHIQPNAVSPKALMTQPKRILAIHSNVIEFQFISIINKQSESMSNCGKHTAENVQELEIQNYRLIQSNINLLGWIKKISIQVKKGLIFATNLIEEFRYYQTTTKLYEMIAELDNYSRESLFDTLYEKVHQKKIDFTGVNPQSKNFIPNEKENKQKLKIYTNIFNMTLERSKEDIVNTKKYENHNKKQKSLFLNFEENIEEELKDTYINTPKFSQVWSERSGFDESFKQNEYEGDIYRFLLIQGSSIQILLRKIRNNG